MLDPRASNMSKLMESCPKGCLTDPDFLYSWETSDGQAANAAGQLKNIGSENEAISVQGSYRFIGDDGVTYEVTYIADENGFQPQGAHLPVAPEA